MTGALSSSTILAVASLVPIEPSDGLDIVAMILSIPSTNVSSVIPKVIVAVEFPSAILNVVAPVAKSVPSVAVPV